jgi:hypothetical protein
MLRLASSPLCRAESELNNGIAKKSGSGRLETRLPWKIESSSSEALKVTLVFVPSCNRQVRKNVKCEMKHIGVKRGARISRNQLPGTFRSAGDNRVKHKHAPGTHFTVSWYVRQRKIAICQEEKEKKLRSKLFISLGSGAKMRTGCFLLTII